jgi:aromatic-L-amino-acid/L-tryptophan decarboxylase
MTIPHMTPDEFRRLGHQMVDWAADYMQRVQGLPVQSRAQPGDLLNVLPEHPPEHPGGEGEWDQIFRDLDETILPGITHWQSSGFFGFFPCNASGPGILGEIASAALNVNGMLWATSPAATELEMRLADWMAQAIGLPETFTFNADGGGCIQGTASESTLIGMLAGRRRALRDSPPPVPGEPARGGLGRLTVYTSTQAHSSIHKAAMILGIATDASDTGNLRLIQTGPDLAMDPAALERAIRADLDAGLTPCCVCATVGTTSTTAIDPVRRIAEVLQRTGVAVGGPRGGIEGGGGEAGGGVDTHRGRGGTRGDRGGRGGCWLHVDAAQAGAACLCPEFRWFLDGVEHADSVTFNPHKSMLTNFDCNLFWVRDRAALVDALSVTPEYLRNPATESGRVIDYRDWQIPLGRRFRALKLWFVIRHYGLEGLRAYVREHMRLAALLEQWVRGDDRFEIAAPRTMHLVCFRPRPRDGESAEDADARSRALLQRLNASGRVYLTHTVIPDTHGRDRFTLRLAVGASSCTERHVRAAWELVGVEAGEV